MGRAMAPRAVRVDFGNTHSHVARVRACVRLRPSEHSHLPHPLVGWTWDLLKLLLFTTALAPMSSNYAQLFYRSTTTRPRAPYYLYYLFTFSGPRVSIRVTSFFFILRARGLG